MPRREIVVGVSGASGASLAKRFVEIALSARGLSRLHLVLSGPALEVGFHTEHKDAARNDDVLSRLVDGEKRWRKALGRAPETGAFLGRQKNWRRVSEIWDGDGLTDDAAVEAAERLGAYIEALEPLRRGSDRKVRA